MGVPFESLIPYGIMLAVGSRESLRQDCARSSNLRQMFGFTGAGLSKIRHMQNGGKRARHSIDQWDHVSDALFVEPTCALDVDLGS